MTLTPTDEQQSVIDAIRQPASQMIRAYAGTAKTTTLVMAAKRVRVPALALAFNKSIAKELGEKLPSNFTTKSLNALGFGAWRRSRPGVTMNVDAQKLGKLVSQVPKDRGVRLSADQWDQLRKMVTGAQAIGLTPKGIGEPLVSDEPESWAEIASRAWIPREDGEWLTDLARDVLEHSITLAEQGIVSFDDQIYCPLVLGGSWLKFPVVFGDEVQDWNGLNHRMAGLSLASGGKLVLAGDPLQAIYAFRGALSDSMGRITKLASEWSHHELTQTFRCPKVVVDRQQRHALGYRAAQSNAEGCVVDWSKVDEIDGLLTEEGETSVLEWTWRELLDVLPSPDASIAILCRNNAPLLSLAFKLLRQGVSVWMIGRDIGKGLKALSKKLAPKDDTTCDDVAIAVHNWRDKELELARLNKAEDSTIDSITDRAECLLAVLGSAGVANAGQLRSVLDSLFARESGRVTLATIHKAKGLEWDCVVHLDPWRVPSKQAKRAALRGDDVPMQQEMNLRYVCETRTKHTLVLASLEDFE